MFTWNPRLRAGHFTLAGVVGVLALSSFSVLPAFAASISPADCATQSGKVSVRAVAISQGDTLTLQATPPDGQYIGQATAAVFCQSKGGNNLGDIPDASITVTINPAAGSGLTASQFTVDGVGIPTTNVDAAHPGNPVQLGPFTGTATFNVVGSSDLLGPGVAAADVGVNIEVVSAAWGGALLDPKTGLLHPGTFGDVLAQTPELDSLPLFASGALGLLGYAALRRRARGSR